jgi:hypothetical protein
MSAFTQRVHLTGEPVEFKTVDLIDGPLDWAMSVALNVPVTVSVSGQCWLADKPKQMYSPHARFRQGAELLDQFDVQLTTGATTGGRVASIDGKFFACGPNMLIATCRVIVMKLLGESVMIPHDLAMAFQIRELERVVSIGESHHE